MFQQQYLFYGRPDPAGGSADVVARQSESATFHHRTVLGTLRADVFIGDWAYRLAEQFMGDGEAGARGLHIVVGALVVLMALIAGFGGVRLGRYHQRSETERQQAASRLGNRLFCPRWRSRW